MNCAVRSQPQAIADGDGKADVVPSPAVSNDERYEIEYVRKVKINAGRAILAP